MSVTRRVPVICAVVATCALAASPASAILPPATDRLGPEAFTKFQGDMRAAGPCRGKTSCRGGFVEFSRGFKRQAAVAQSYVSTLTPGPCQITLRGLSIELKGLAKVSQRFAAGKVSNQTYAKAFKKVERASERVVSNCQ